MRTCQWQDRIVFALVIGLCVGGSSAHATGPNVMSYKKTYPDAKGVSCKTCHENTVGKATDLNAYGKALQQLKGEPGHAKNLTAEDYKQFDAADNDQDGATNRAELDAGTDLNDPASKP